MLPVKFWGCALYTEEYLVCFVLNGLTIRKPYQKMQNLTKLELQLPRESLL